MRNIIIRKEVSCGNLWCIAVNGWYVKEGGYNKTFLTKKEATKYVRKNLQEVPK